MSLRAQSLASSESLRRNPGSATTLAAAVARMKAGASDAAGSPKVIQLEKAYHTFLIPAAGSVQGSGGTYFRSDFSISNNRGSSQRIGIGWVAQGVDNSNSLLDYYDIPGTQTVIQQDVVGQLLGQSGLGSLLVFAELPSGSTDLNARLLGFSRIWTNQPNATGTVSLQFPAVSPNDSLSTAHGYAIGLRHDGQYRTNVGIVNLDTVSHTWTVRIVGLTQSGQFNVTVLPFSMMQVPLPSGNYGDLFLDLQATAGSNFYWSGYGASVDNTTGDGWVSRAIQP
jgi:hypothetical protein